MRKRRNYVANHAKKQAADDNDIRVLFRRFVSIKTAEGVSESTVGQYEDNFAFFCEYIEKRGGDYDVAAITQDFLREWITYMQFDHIQFRKIATRKVKEVGLKPSTINTRIKTIRVMFNTLFHEGIISDNPCARLRNVSEPVEDIEVLSDREIARLLGVMDKSYYTVYRDYVLIVFLLDSMMRISEAVRLTRDRIDREAGVVIIPANIAKNRKARAVPISDKVIRLLDELMKENDHEFRSEYVFATGEDSYYDRNTFNQRLKDYGEAAQINKNIHAHLFRHTAATRWLENGGIAADTRTLQIRYG